MSFKVPDVPFISSGLPGFLSAHAVQIHVTKHHRAYVDFANRYVPACEFHGKDIQTILKMATGTIFNNVAQHYNHSFFWDCLSATQSPIPAPVSAFLVEHFGTVDAFKTEFTQKASTIFGSGWCYLAVNADKSVTINQYLNANNPIKDGGYPLLTVDTWEHAWYVDYENRKAEYFAKFWNCVNWEFVEKRIQGLPMPKRS
jgi:Fe-Mn family superoxide dismutase